MARVSGKQDQGGDLTAVGDAIRLRRLKLDMSQEALADASGIDRSHLGRIERGERNVTLLNLLKIAEAVGQRPSELLKSAGL